MWSENRAVLAMRRIQCKNHTDERESALAPTSKYHSQIVYVARMVVIATIRAFLYYGTGVAEKVTNTPVLSVCVFVTQYLKPRGRVELLTVGC